MSHTDINGRPARRAPYRKAEDGPRASEHGAGQHPSSGRMATGTRSGYPTKRGEGFGGYTDGKPIRNYLPKK